MDVIGFILKKVNLTQNKEKIVRNLIWSVLGKVVTLLNGLLVGIIVAKCLGPTQYGIMNYVISFVALFQPFAMFGLDSIEIREESRGKVPFNVIIGTAFRLRVFLALFFMALLICCSLFTESDGNIILLISIYSISILLSSANVIRNHFTSLVRNEYVVKSEINRTVVGMVIKLLLLYYDASLACFIIAYTFDAVLLASGYFLSYKHCIGNVSEWKFDSNVAKFMLKEAFPLVLTYSAVIVYQRIDQLMIGNMINKESVGYFSYAAKFVEILIYVSTMLVQTITPILVKTREDSIAEYTRKGQQFMNVTFWIGIIGAACLSCCSYWIVLYTVGEEYIASVAVLQVLAFKAASFALSSTGGTMIIIEGLQKYSVLRDILGCACCVVLNLLLLPRYGVVAAAIVAIFSNLMAGYISGLLVPVYRHIFFMQTKAIVFGWRDLINLKSILKR